MSKIHSLCTLRRYVYTCTGISHQDSKNPIDVKRCLGPGSRNDFSNASTIGRKSLGGKRSLSVGYTRKAFRRVRGLYHSRARRRRRRRLGRMSSARKPREPTGTRNGTSARDPAASARPSGSSARSGGSGTSARTGTSSSSSRPTSQPSSSSSGQTSSKGGGGGAGAGTTSRSRGVSPKHSGGLKQASQPGLLECVQKRFEKDVFESAASKFLLLQSSL